MRITSGFGLAGLALSFGLTNAIELDLDSRDSILNASKTVVDNIIAEYNTQAGVPGGTPGLLPQPYYWWNAGNMFNSLIKYWALSGDDSVVPTITEALLFQVGPDQNYMPPNQSKSLGNDDQAAWALAAMSAAEYGFPNPPEDQPQWLDLAEAVFWSQVPRWDESSCGGVRASSLSVDILGHRGNVS
jgi:mannan endo-1,6-alpha-mannosidase